jgi:lipooligosaccharide transport system permease protein
MSALQPALASYAYWLTAYRRTWRGSAASSVLAPVLYLGALGFGLGSLVDASAGGVDGIPYFQFVAPGLLAATAMQIASFESTYPVMGAIKWHKQYIAQLATPLAVRDVLAGHLLFIATRIGTSCAVYVAVILLFGGLLAPTALLALPAALLVGMAFAVPITAFAARQQNDAGFAGLFRFGIIPLFLFSGTFFPVSQLPAFLQPIAYVTPLWHGVELCRGLMLGTAGVVSAAMHVLYLGVWVVGGVVLALLAFRSRLID